jgi:hypothetical protein
VDREKIFNLLFIVAIVLASLNVIFIFNKLDTLTGQVTESGFANLTVEALASVNFTTDVVNWGSGVVDSGESNAYLDTATGTVVKGNWTVNSAGLVLENIGNVNVTLKFTAGKTAATFLGGTSPSYQWNFSNVEADSCINTTNYSTIGTLEDVNTTGTTVCSIFEFADARDTIRIDLNLTVPSDSFTGALTDTITATAVAA